MIDKNISQSVIAALAMVLLCGCCHPWHQQAFVCVSQPEIFTRERLVQERNEEVQFLQSALKKVEAPQPQFTGYQGYENIDVVESFANALNVKYGVSSSSASGKAGNSGSNGSGTAAPAATMPSISITNTNSINGASGTSGPTTRSAGADGSSENGKGAGQNASSDKSGGTSSSSQPMTASPIDVLSDTLAYRNAINAATKEKMLDDTHDLRGLTLYTLKLDLSVLPGRAGDLDLARPLVLLLELDDRRWNDEDASAGTTYNNWIDHLNREIQVATQVAENRLIQDRLTEKDIALIIESLAREASSRQDNTNTGTSQRGDSRCNIDAALASFKNYLLMSHAQRRQLFTGKEIKQAPQERGHLKYAVAFWILHQYKDRLEPAQEAWSRAYSRELAQQMRSVQAAVAKQRSVALALRIVLAELKDARREPPGALEDAVRAVLEAWEAQERIRSARPLTQDGIEKAAREIAEKSLQYANSAVRAAQPSAPNAPSGSSGSTGASAQAAPSTQSNETADLEARIWRSLQQLVALMASSTDSARGATSQPPADEKGGSEQVGPRSEDRTPMRRAARAASAALALAKDQLEIAAPELRQAIDNACKEIVRLPKEPEPVGKEGGDSEPFYINYARSTPSGRVCFSEIMRSLDRSNFPRAFAMEPKEYAQNISDTSQRQATLDLSLTLAAAFGSLNVDDTAKYLKQTHTALQAIKRHPLAIGFGSGRRQFGWLLGPRFYIQDDGKPGREHTPVRHSFAAEIGVPAWWSGVGLKGQCFWLNEDGTLEKAMAVRTFDLIGADPVKTYGSGAGEIKSDEGDDFFNSEGIFNDGFRPFHRDDDNRMKVGEIWPPYEFDADAGTPGPDLLGKRIFRSTLFLRLPSDPAAITTALLYKNDRAQRQPLLELLWHAEVLGDGQSPAYTLRESKSADEDQTLIIRGRELWRNPAVTVGNMVASKVEILPDMNGLIAHFGQVKPLASGALADLTVTTSFGSDTLHDAVRILPAAGAVKPIALLTLDQHFAVADGHGQLSATVDAAKGDAVAAANAKLALRVHGAPGGDWHVVASQPISVAGGKLVFAIPAGNDLRDKYNVAPPPDPGTPRLLDVDVVVNDGTTSTSLLGSPQTLVLYAQDLDRKLSCEAKEKRLQTKNLPSGDAKTDRMLLLQAYPDLQRAIHSKVLEITLTDVNSNQAAGKSLHLDQKGLSDPIGQVPDGSYEAAVTWQDPQGSRVSIPVADIVEVSNKGQNVAVKPAGH